MQLAFTKYEGAGNDFVIVEAEDESRVTAEMAAKICDRHFGVGADGVLLLLPSRDAGAARRMRVLNADGSVPEMCGNGLRCVALHLVKGTFQSATVVVDTDAGLRSCLVEKEEAAGSVVVDMGDVRVTGTRALTAAGGPHELVLADAGNPHAILFGEFGRAQIEAIGPVIATDASFVAGTNVEFAGIRDGRIELVVWERGVGITMACGTGACATAVAAWEKKLVPEGPTRVALPGGELVISRREPGHILMRGPARRVFRGTLE
jgi:diaminopimelate epimerase